MKHKIRVEAEQTGVLVMDGNQGAIDIEFKTESQKILGEYECICGESFKNKKDVKKHLHES